MYKVIVDSSADMTEELKRRYPVTFVPFKLYVDETEYVDNDQMDVDGFIADFSKNHKPPRSAAPSPHDFLEKLEGADEYYIVTITGKLSATHNSALLAKEMFETEKRPGRVAVIDSKSAACGETLLCTRIHELKEQGKSFAEVVKDVTKFAAGMKTYFITESLSNLIKNGRISKWKGLLATTLGIVPIMGAEDGEIKPVEKVRNLNKAYDKLVSIIAGDLGQNKKDKVVISHVSNIERAQWLCDELLKIDSVKEVLINKCAGLSSMYADKKGVIVSF